MARRLFFSSLPLILSLAFVVIGNSGSIAEEKLKFATVLKTHPFHALPALAVQEKGFWKEEGLNVEWVSFRAPAAFYRATAAGAIDMGMGSALSTIHGVIRGVPIIIIAAMARQNHFYAWVAKDSPIKEGKDLKGAKIGVIRKGGAGHLFAQSVAQALGLGKDIRYIASGSMPQELAAFRRGLTDSLIFTSFTMIKMKLKGQVREILAVRDYLPQPWLEQILVARKELVNNRPQPARKTVKGFLRATRFVMENRSWAIEKMVSYSRYSREAAEILFKDIQYARDNRIKREAISNVTKFLVTHGLIPREKALPPEQLFTEKLLPR